MIVLLLAHAAFGKGDTDEVLREPDRIWNGKHTSIRDYTSSPSWMFGNRSVLVRKSEDSQGLYGAIGTLDMETGSFRAFGFDGRFFHFVGLRDGIAVWTHGDKYYSHLAVFDFSKFEIVTQEIEGQWAVSPDGKFFVYRTLDRYDVPGELYYWTSASQERVCFKGPEPVQPGVAMPQYYSMSGSSPVVADTGSFVTRLGLHDNTGELIAPVDPDWEMKVKAKTISRDGGTAAFIVKRKEEPEFRLLVLNSDGEQVFEKRIEVNPKWNVGQLSISDDGEKIAFIVDKLRLLDLSGEPEIRVADTVEYIVSARISADGRHIAVIDDRRVFMFDDQLNLEWKSITYKPGNARALVISEDCDALVVSGSTELWYFKDNLDFEGSADKRRKAKD